jgi:hypothetical protein
MKNTILISLFLVLSTYIYSQETFTSRKGSKLFPGHHEIVITVDSCKVRYELFNHWYTNSYAELRQITIATDSLKHYSESNDTLQIIIADNYVKITDKRYKINKKVKHKRLCNKPDIMRKISFAHSQARKHKGIGHYELYTNADLKLNEADFKRLVLLNLNKLLSTH